MLSLSLFVVLAILAGCMNGSKRTIHVSSSTGGESYCCVYGNCSCGSLDHALANLASNVLINITTDVILSSLVKSSKLERVSIVGYNNPTVKCENGGGIHYTSCYDCTIHNIVWDGCGTKRKPAMKFGKSANILINNCTFQYSKGQAVVLSGTREDVNIHHCDFMHNSHYTSHGAAIYYLSNAKMNCLPAISQCSFMYNEGAKSLVYMEGRMLKQNNLTFNYFKFCHNQGFLIYAVNLNIHIYGKNIFENNTAKNEAGVHIRDNSVVTFGKNSQVVFVQNSAGVLIFQKTYSSIIFDHNSVAMFSDNEAAYGVLYSETNCSISFTATCKVKFSGNFRPAGQYGYATEHFIGLGGMIFSYDNSYISFEGNSYAEFSNNYIPDLNGGVIYSQLYSFISFKGNSSTVFVNNTALYGGAIFSHTSSMSFEETSSTVFSSNNAKIAGGVIVMDDGNITFNGKASTVFSNNSADVYGGAIFLYHGLMSFKGNSSTMLSNNSANENGGAIVCFANSYVSFKENAFTVFYSNSAEHDGGAVYSYDNSYITFGGKASTNFSNNTANQSGGAIFSFDNSHVSFEENAGTVFSSNSANLDGGVVYSYDNSYITFGGKASTNFSNNFANRSSGAILSYDYSPVYFEGNAFTVFSNNVAYAFGGAICIFVSTLSFTGKASTLFSSNAGQQAGAMCSITGHVSFEENAFTIFSNNSARNKAGGAISLLHSATSFGGNASTLFSYNTAYLYGGAIVCNSPYSYISFEGTSSTTFINNSVEHDGGAIFANDTNIFFEGNSFTLFDNNTANETGGALSLNSTSISFEGNSSTVFNSNNATLYGGAIHCTTLKVHYDSFIDFKGNSSTTFSNNNVKLHGGAIYLFSISMYFEGNSFTMFINNTAFYGGAIYSATYANISFKANASTIFFNNIADNKAGAIYLYKWVSIIFEGNSSTKFDSNNAKMYQGGAIYSTLLTRISFEGNASTKFNNNSGNNGGAIAITNSHLSFEGTSSTVFNHNKGYKVGGAIHSLDTSISFRLKSTTQFCNNSASYSGGAVYLVHCNVSFEGFSVTAFSSNIAEIGVGAALLIGGSSTIYFSDSSTVSFANNKALNDVIIYSREHSRITATQNFTVMFNNFTPKWYNNICLKYVIDGFMIINVNGIVWCADQKAFMCLSNKCHLKKFEDLFPRSTFKTNNTIANITDNMMLSSDVILTRINNFTFTGYNTTVFCHGGATLHFSRCSNIKIEGIIWIGCGKDTSAVTSINVRAVIHTEQSYNITIQNCTFQHSIGPIIIINNFNMPYGHVTINYCNFSYNTYYTGHGKVITYRNIISEEITETFKININNCKFSHNGKTESLLYYFILHDENFKSITHIYLNNSIFQNNQGVSVYLPHDNFVLHIDGEVLFENNVAESGAAIYINEGSNVIFHENSQIKFVNNSVNHNGAAMFLNNRANVIFEQNSYVAFNNNKATNGTIYCKTNSRVMFKATSRVIFSGNSATQYGSAVYCFDNSQVTFTENSVVIFSNNIISSRDANLQLGGTMFSDSNCHISFEKNTFTQFSSNSADFGAAILSLDNSSIVFRDQSEVMFTNNVAQSCGALTIALLSTINFTDNVTVTFDTNTASYTLNSSLVISAGAMCTIQAASITFSGYSLIKFTNNTAYKGGATAFSESNVILQDHSSVTFDNNIAQYSSGGALTCAKNSNITVKGNSNVTFNSNSADQSGGAIHAYGMCKITFKGNSTSMFIKNNVRNNGGAIFSSQASEITFKGQSTVAFDDNTADNGAAFYFARSFMIFKEASSVTCYNNMARQNGGVGYFSLNSKMILEATTTVRFKNNMAEQDAGALYCKESNITFSGKSTVTLTSNTALYGGAISANDHSNITLTENSVLKFASNEALQSGGATYLNSHCSIVITESVMVTYDDNEAIYGGAVCVNNNTNITIKGNSTLFFYNNLATEDGGAINILNNSRMTLYDRITMKFSGNNARYGGAIYIDRTAVLVNSSDKECLNFEINFARVLGTSVYQDVPKLCNSSCLANTMIGVSDKVIATPPNELRFYDPAICIDDDNDTECNSYFVQNIMLGREIIIQACMLDYYNQPVESKEFLIQNETHLDYFISGPRQVLIFCDAFKGISIMGNKSLSKSKNFSITVTLNTRLYSDWKEILVNLIIGLSPCHPGFWQHSKSEKCECYNANDIVFCSDGTSTIKRGYWFGSVTGKPTTTLCPINYCNFTCCETSNGYYQLSPVRKDQCRSHRSGTACGSCTDGYTLSFDSTECVSIESCTAGQTVLVILLTVAYWIVMIALIFGMMYYRAGIGYLYSITYYYSIVDFLLSQNLQGSRGLYLTVNIISSFSRITPQFLGEFCLANGISGIDQQFIHYIHPTAVILILVVISVSARNSKKISAIISRGIIHVICLLLLLSYTSIASTSLLQIRSLTFHDIDKVYTYLSPDIEYFHGRHLAYGVVALLCIVIILIGLPFLLIVEPFLNHKINFTRIKPLLDQFQGCYRDKYRCFAGYYMICRLVITGIVIVNASNYVVANYMVVVFCGITDFIHLIMRPYNKMILNKFDGTVLHFTIFVAILPLFEDFDSPSVITTTFVLVTLPLLNLIAITMFLHKGFLKKIRNLMYKDESPSNNEVSMTEFGLVDTSVRVNDTVRAM